jgi:hypothetical protein
MFFKKMMEKRKERKENEMRLRKLHGWEVRYVTTINPETYVEYIIGKYGVINITEDDNFVIICSNKIVFSHSIEGLQGSELMSLDGIILSYTNEETGEFKEVVAYYKYHRK